MKRKFIGLICVILTLAIAAGCKRLVDGELKLSQYEMTFEASGGDQTLRAVKGVFLDWHYHMEGAGWCYVIGEEGSSEITIHCDANETELNRECEISFMNGDAYGLLKVTQKAK